jgi:predicted CxxxxCH...CXXCH cytochrome family protein
MHGNGTIDIELYNVSASGFKANNPITASKTGSGNNTVCNNVYCHSNGAEGANRAYKATPQWGSTFGANKCGGCHDNPPQYAGQSHYNATGFMGKEGGHLVGIHFDNIYTGSTGLASAGTDGTNSHGNSAYSTTISCYICHNGIVSSTTIDTYALYNLTSSAMKCSNCHTSNTPTPLQNGIIVNKSLHINAVKNVSFADNFIIKSKAQLRDGSRPNFWTRNVGYKVPLAYDSATMNSFVWDPGTKTCTTACHNNVPVQWGATNVTCNSCHTDL